MRLKDVVCNPKYYGILAIGRILPDKLWADEFYLRLLYRNRMHKKLDLNNPKTYNEKLQWLKLHDRKPEYTQMVDKCAAKKYVAERIGEEYIVPTLGVWNRFEDIDFDALPNQFVLKCTHDSGGLVICRDKNKLDIEKAKKKINSSLKRNYFYSGRENPYRDVPPRIIAEKFMVDESGVELKDYKIFCFNGKPMYIQVDFGRYTEHERNMYSTNWDYMGFSSRYPTNPDRVIEKPLCLEKMLEVAANLSAGIPHLRVDLYVINEKVHFGELTFYHGSGFEKFKPEEWDRKLGDMIDLSLVKH